mgnify:FL=1
MAANTRSVGILPATPANIRHAAAALRAGELVGLPTETVYGVAARADDPAAIARLFRAKGRDESKQVARFVADLDGVRAAGATVSDVARRLAAAFWPGPLTLVLPGADGAWLGFRAPAHDVAQAWLRELGGVIPAVTSANRSGKAPAGTAAAAWAALSPHLSMVLDGGPVTGGQPSTVLRVAGAEAEILRPGPITAEHLARIPGLHLRST